MYRFCRPSVRALKSGFSSTCVTRSANAAVKVSNNSAFKKHEKIVQKFRYFSTSPDRRSEEGEAFSRSDIFRDYDQQQGRTSLLAKLPDTPGALHDVLKYFWKYDISLTHIDSRPCPKDSNGFDIVLDFAGRIGEPKIDQLVGELQSKYQHVLVLGEKEVPWFPRHISELDALASRSLDAGSDLEADHPGFSDNVYRARRGELATIAETYRFGEPVPYIEYTPEEIATWGTVYENLKSLQDKYACKEYRDVMPLMEEYCGYGRDRIPQAQDISDFLKQRTGFQLRPVTGLLTARDFLNGLAFRSFFSTQYIRHSSMPLYTPEPDICHELLGHVPMFADPDFADFSQEIGLASLGARDEDIVKLATCYWHSVEFGLVRDSDSSSSNNSTGSTCGRGSGSGSGVKAYGAGLLSSFGELEYACKDMVFPYALPTASASASTTTTTTPSTTTTGISEAYAGNSANTNSSSDGNPSVLPEGGAEKPNLLAWDPHVASVTTYPITTYQPTYFVAESLADAKVKMRAYCEQLPRPFFARYDDESCSIWVDRAVRRES